MAPFSARLFVWRDPIQVGCLPVPMKRPRVLFAEKLLLGGLLKRAVDRPQILPIWGVLLRADTCSRIRTIRESRLQQADFRVELRSSLQVEASRERSGRRGASGLSALACYSTRHDRAIPLSYSAGLPSGGLASEVSSETIASFTARGDCFSLGDLCPSAPSREIATIGAKQVFDMFCI